MPEDGSYYSSGVLVYKAPTSTIQNGDRHTTMGFTVCEVSHSLNEPDKVASLIAAALSNYHPARQ
ncbi:MAG: hypothetical protein JKY98_05215 [Gammaproteobacteria bacterium]|nr:hypothetical protein [Gammaproteobacteria bacterium]